MKKITITNNTKEKVFTDIFLMQENNEPFMLMTSYVSGDMLVKLIGLGEPISINISERNIEQTYETIRELNLHDSSLVTVAVPIGKHNKYLVSDIIQTFEMDHKLSPANIFMFDGPDKLDTEFWNNLICTCLDHDLRISCSKERLDDYVESIS